MNDKPKTETDAETSKADVDQSPADPIETPEAQVEDAQAADPIPADDTPVEDADTITDPAPAEDVAEDTAEDSTPETQDDDEDATSEEQGVEPEPASDLPVESAHSPEPKVVERVVETKRGGFFPAVLGGIVAAGIGFVAGQNGVLNDYLPASVQGGMSSEAVQTLRSDLAAQSARIAEVTDQVAALVPADLTGVETRLDALENAAPAGDLTALTAQMTELAERLSALENRPAGPGGSAPQGDLTELRESVAALRGEVETLLSNAKAREDDIRAQQAAAEQAAAQAEQMRAVAVLRSAAESGAPFADELAAVADLGLVIPEALTAAAADGVASVSALADSFPEAARAALAAARAETAGSGGFAAYLRRQLGARSTTPREGDDPDAVLSRTEAAVHGGDVAGALETLTALPDSARAELADWIATAEARLTTLSAIDTLAQTRIAE